MTDQRITIADCREAGYCSRGVRRFCLSSGYDFAAFCRDGAAISDLEDVADGRIQTLIRRVREKQHGR